jgi:hypothetical protein
MRLPLRDVVRDLVRSALHGAGQGEWFFGNFWIEREVQSQDYCFVLEISSRIGARYRQVARVSEMALINWGERIDGFAIQGLTQYAQELVHEHYELHAARRLMETAFVPSDLSELTATRYTYTSTTNNHTIPFPDINEARRLWQENYERHYRRLQELAINPPYFLDPESGIRPLNAEQIRRNEAERELAEHRGIQLLLENLTEEQKAEYKFKRYFHVKGGDTGNRYRIHHGRQMNINHVSEDGRSLMGYCFLPQGGLVAGDCMLAQKTALELFERDALKVANKFPLPGGHEQVSFSLMGSINSWFR